MCTEDDLELTSSFTKSPSKGLQALIQAPIDCSQCEDRLAAETLLSMGQSIDHNCVETIDHNCVEVQNFLLPPSELRQTSPLIDFHMLTPPPSDGGFTSDDSCDIYDSRSEYLKNNKIKKQQQNLDCQGRPLSVLAQVGF